MRIKNHLIAKTIVAHIILYSIAFGEQQDTVKFVKDLEAKIIAQRLKIEKWHASARTKFGGKRGSSETVVGIDQYVDGIWLRRDLHNPYNKSVQRPDPERLTYEEILSYTDKHAYEYSSRGKVGQYNTPLVIKNIDDVRRPTIRNTIMYDLRAVGNYPNGALSPEYSVDGTLRLTGGLLSKSPTI